MKRAKRRETIGPDTMCGPCSPQKHADVVLGWRDRLEWTFDRLRAEKLEWLHHEFIEPGDEDYDPFDVEDEELLQEEGRLIEIMQAETPPMTAALRWIFIGEMLHHGVVIGHDSANWSSELAGHEEMALNVGEALQLVFLDLDTLGLRAELYSRLRRVRVVRARLRLLSAKISASAGDWRDAVEQLQMAEILDRRIDLLAQLRCCEALAMSRKRGASA